MTKLHTTTLEELTDEVFGPIGTPERDAFEQELARELQARKATKQNTPAIAGEGESGQSYVAKQ